MYPTIFIVKESRHDEKRVSLIPKDVASLIQMGATVLVEDQAGVGAGFVNKDYQTVGASICELKRGSFESYQSIFNNVDIIVRVKRPDRTREQLENLAIKSGTKMVGSLDVLERDSHHLKEYHAAGIDYYSFDQYIFPPNSPPIKTMQTMSVIAGELAVQDAIQKINHIAKQAVIIGYGVAGQAAHQDCLQRNITCTVITSDQNKIELIQSKGSDAVYLSRELPLDIKQEKVKKVVSHVDFVITAASSNGETAPILITKQSFQVMKSGTVIVDLAVAEGGNVAGSKPDTTLLFENNIVVTNVSGYPKAMAIEVSKEWSNASYYLLKLLIKRPELIKQMKRR